MQDSVSPVVCVFLHILRAAAFNDPFSEESLRSTYLVSSIISTQPPPGFMEVSQNCMTSETLERDEEVIESFLLVL